MFRDGFYYGLSIILFIIFSWDGVIEMYEAVILLVLYILYIVIMVFNPRLMDLLGNFT
jgi:Ca2+/Na+ antiporter